MEGRREGEGGKEENGRGRRDAVGEKEEGGRGREEGWREEGRGGWEEGGLGLILQKMRRLPLSSCIWLWRRER